jgi:hypothetical protein
MGRAGPQQHERGNIVAEADDGGSQIIVPAVALAARVVPAVLVTAA